MQALVIAAILGSVGIAATAQAAGQCRAASGATPPTVVELYTSEGCSSCPPADKWLSTLKGRDDVLALAFHVNYWDRLGWTDRYATPEGTQRQRDQARHSGSTQVYTPQVLVNGRDWRSWPRLPAAASRAATSTPSVVLTREGQTVTAQVGATPGAARWAAYWAVLEDGHQSAVKAGENMGETLRHDHVVRLLRPLSPWAASAGLRADLALPAADASHPRRVALVIVDADSGAPLQAVTLGC